MPVFQRQSISQFIPNTVFNDYMPQYVPTPDISQDLAKLDAQNQATDAVSAALGEVDINALSFAENDLQIKSELKGVQAGLIDSAYRDPNPYSAATRIRMGAVRMKNLITKSGNKFSQTNLNYKRYQESLENRQKQIMDKKASYLPRTLEAEIRYNQADYVKDGGAVSPEGVLQDFNWNYVGSEIKTSDEALKNLYGKIGKEGVGVSIDKAGNIIADNPRDKGKMYRTQVLLRELKTQYGDIILREGGAEGVPWAKAFAVGHNQLLTDDGYISSVREKFNQDILFQVGLDENAIEDINRKGGTDNWDINALKYIRSNEGNNAFTSYLDQVVEADATKFADSQVSTDITSKMEVIRQSENNLAKTLENLNFDSAFTDISAFSEEQRAKIISEAGKNLNESTQAWADMLKKVGVAPDFSTALKDKEVSYNLIHDIAFNHNFNIRGVDNDAIKKMLARPNGDGYFEGHEAVRILTGDRELADAWGAVNQTERILNNNARPIGELGKDFDYTGRLTDIFTGSLGKTMPGLLAKVKKQIPATEINFDDYQHEVEYEVKTGTVLLERTEPKKVKRMLTNDEKRRIYNDALAAYYQEVSKKLKDNNVGIKRNNIIPGKSGIFKEMHDQLQSWVTSPGVMVIDEFDGEENRVTELALKYADRDSWKVDNVEIFATENTVSKGKGLNADVFNVQVTYKDETNTDRLRNFHITRADYETSGFAGEAVNTHIMTTLNEATAPVDGGKDFRTTLGYKTTHETNITDELVADAMRYNKPFEHKVVRRGNEYFGKIKYEKGKWYYEERPQIGQNPKRPVAPRVHEFGSLYDINTYIAAEMLVQDLVSTPGSPYSPENGDALLNRILYLYGEDYEAFQDGWKSSIE